MTTNGPVTTVDARFSMEGAPAIPWPDARRELEEAGTFWLSTVRSDGRPHVTTLIAVWNDDALYLVHGVLPAGRVPGRSDLLRGAPA